MLNIIKVKVIQDWVKDRIKVFDLEPDDLVLIHFEKIEGSPTEWLQKKFLKRKDEDD